MYCGQSARIADTAKLLDVPKHSYTVALLKAMPDFNDWIPHKEKSRSYKQIPSIKAFTDWLPASPRAAPYAIERMRQILNKSS